jgi:hypothetical protein
MAFMSPAFISVSPLRIEDEETDMFMTSAPLFAGQLERGLGAGRCLEQVDLGATAQGGALLVDLAVELTYPEGRAGR